MGCLLLYFLNLHIQNRILIRFDFLFDPRFSLFISSTALCACLMPGIVRRNLVFIPNLPVMRGFILLGRRCFLVQPCRNFRWQLDILPQRLRLSEKLLFRFVQLNSRQSGTEIFMRDFVEMIPCRTAFYLLLFSCLTALQQIFRFMPAELGRHIAKISGLEIPVQFRHLFRCRFRSNGVNVFIILSLTGRTVTLLKKSPELRQVSSFMGRFLLQFQYSFIQNRIFVCFNFLFDPRLDPIISLASGRIERSAGILRRNFVFIPNLPVMRGFILLGRRCFRSQPCRNFRRQFAILPQRLRRSKKLLF